MITSKANMKLYLTALSMVLVVHIGEVKCACSFKSMGELIDGEIRCVYNGVQVPEQFQFYNDECQKCHCSGGIISCCGFGRVAIGVDYRCKVVQLTKCYDMVVLKNGGGPCTYGHGFVAT